MTDELQKLTDRIYRIEKTLQERLIEEEQTVLRQIPEIEHLSWTCKMNNYVALMMKVNDTFRLNQEYLEGKVKEQQAEIESLKAQLIKH